MNKKLLLVIGGVLAALLVVGAVGATAAYAQADTNTPMHRGGPGGDGAGRGHGLGDAELAAAADVLGMTTDEVTTALLEGKTLRDLADDAGVDIEDVKAAIQAVHETEMRDRIAQAVEDGSMTQAKADWLLEGLDQGYIGAGEGGFGFGGGHGPKGPGPAAGQNDG